MWLAGYHVSSSSNRQVPASNIVRVGDECQRTIRSSTPEASGTIELQRYLANRWRTPVLRL